MKLRTLILHLESTRTRYHHHPSEIKAESESPLAASVDSVGHSVHAPKSYCSRDSFHCYYLVGPNIPIYSHGHSNSHLMLVMAKLGKMWGESFLGIQVTTAMKFPVDPITYCLFTIMSNVASLANLGKCGESPF